MKKNLQQKKRWLLSLLMAFLVSYSFINAQTLDQSGVFEVPISDFAIVYAEFRITHCETCAETDSTFDGNLSLYGDLGGAAFAWGSPAVQVRFATPSNPNRLVDVRSAGAFVALDSANGRLPEIIFDTVYYCWIEIDNTGESYSVYFQAVGEEEPLKVAAAADGLDIFAFRTRTTTYVELSNWAIVRNPANTSNILVLDSIALVEEIGFPEEVGIKANTMNDIFNCKIYPNPVTNVSQITYNLPEASTVELIVYDLQGKKVKSFVNENQTVGKNNFEINRADFSEGIYFYKLSAGNYSVTGKMVVNQ